MEPRARGVWAGAKVAAQHNGFTFVDGSILHRLLRKAGMPMSSQPPAAGPGPHAAGGRRRTAALAALLLCVVALAVPAAAAETSPEPAQEESFPGGANYRPGAPGLGDPYFPLDGNGGYDVDQYLLDLSYDPLTDILAGTATITAKATQDLSAFNLDLDGMTVRGVKVKGRSAEFTRDAGELTVTPQRGIRDGSRFITQVRYDGVPETISELFGQSGFFHTDDGSLVIGQPHVAATWFPVNDHPLDKASYTFRITVPEGLEVVANGRLVDNRTRDGLTTWTWEAREPMASYLATASVGQWDFNEYRAGRINYLDALDPDLFDPVAEPRTGSQFRVVPGGGQFLQTADPNHRRPGRRGAAVLLADPRYRAQLGFRLRGGPHRRRRRLDHSARCQRAHLRRDGSSCPGWHSLHPFLTHYQTGDGAGGCTAAGSSGVWWAASGASDGWEQWSADLAGFAGRTSKSPSATSVTTSPSIPACLSTMWWSPRARAAPPSRTTAILWTAGRSPVRRRAARETRTTGP